MAFELAVFSSHRKSARSMSGFPTKTARCSIEIKKASRMLYFSSSQKVRRIGRGRCSFRANALRNSVSVEEAFSSAVRGSSVSTVKGVRRPSRSIGKAQLKKSRRKKGELLSGETSDIFCWWKVRQYSSG